MTAAVRKKDEELTINLKCIIDVLMTDSGLSRVSGFHVKRKGRKRIPCRAFAAVREGALPAL